MISITDIYTKDNDRIACLFQTTTNMTGGFNFIFLMITITKGSGLDLVQCEMVGEGIITWLSRIIQQKDYKYFHK